jgi:RNase H-fold protein (predicted Holliday junction resolvase)
MSQIESKKAEKSYVMGLDISTKTIGMSLFDIHGKLVELTHFTPKIKPQPENKLEELFRKVDAFEKVLTRYVDLDIQKVIIEEPLLNSNNVRTVATLLRFNGMISKIVDEVLGVIPDFISSYDARAFAFPELMAVRTHDKKGQPYKEKELKDKKPSLFGGYPWDVDKKMVVFEKVADREPQIVWEYDKNFKLKKENFDMTDSYAAVMGYMKKNSYWV